jgi:hypothetical protein
MMTDDDPTAKALQARMQYLLDLDISIGLPPEQRLLLAVLRQSVIDYFGDDPLERLSAALYFARSPVYKTTLQLFNLPDNLLPLGVDLSAFRKKENLSVNYELDPLRLETLVRQLSGTQLKIVLSMGLLSLPAATRKISLNCGLTRSTVLIALDQLATQGLVIRHDDDTRVMWSLPESVRRVLDEVWGM